MKRKILISFLFILFSLPVVCLLYAGPNITGGITGSGSGSGYTNLTEFVGQTAWRLFYSDGSGDVKELGLGADGTYLKSNGAAVAPSFDTPATGDVSKVGTPTNHQWGVWTGDGTLKGSSITASKVVCTDGNGDPTACTNLTDTAFSGYIPYSLYTAANDFLIGTGVGTATKKTLSETQAILFGNAYNGFSVDGSGNILTSGSISGSSISSSGNVSGASLVSSSLVSGTSLNITGAGSLASVISSSLVSGTSLNITGAGSLASVVTSGPLIGNTVTSPGLGSFMSVSINGHALPTSGTTCFWGFNDSGVTGCYGNFNQTQTFETLLWGDSTGKTAELKLGSGMSGRLGSAPNATGGFVTADAKIRLATFGWDGGTSAIGTGATAKVCTVIPHAGTITGVTIFGDASTTSTVALFKDAFSTSALATTDITGGKLVKVVATIGSQPSVSGWTTTIAANDQICAQVNVNDNAKKLNVMLEGMRQ
jgi:hypothetical protein